MVEETGKVFKKEKNLKKGKPIGILNVEVSKKTNEIETKTTTNHNRHLVSHMYIGQQLHMPLLAAQERPRLHHQGWRLAQDVTMKAFSSEQF